MPPPDPRPGLAAARLIELDVIPPVGYSPLWLVLAALLVLAAVGWCVSAVLRTRPPRPARTVPRPAPDLHANCIRRIDSVRRRVRAGELTARAGHQELSAVVRELVHRTIGAPVQTMTLVQLRDLATRSARTGEPVGKPGEPAHHATGPTLVDLAHYVEALYTPEFAPQTVRSVDAAADRAEQLVRAWR